MRRFLLVSGLLCAAATAACGGDASPGPATGCAPGQTAAADGCFEAGLVGCSAEFVEDDGICRPSVAKCPAGTIPKFAVGCVAVGIPNAAKAFVGADGIAIPASASCPAAARASPKRGCVSLDGADGCGAGTWGSIPDGADNVYVDASAASAGADGSKSKPFPTIAAALARVVDGGRIAIAEGRYAESLAVTKSIEIAGRCPSMVTIGAFDTSSRPRTIDARASVVIRGVTLSGDGVGLYADGAPAKLDTVVVDGALGAGVVAHGGAATMTITSTLIRGTRAVAQQGGEGLVVEAGAAVTVEDSAIVANTDSGVRVDGAGTKLTLDGSLIEGTVPNPTPDPFGIGDGQGVLVTGKASATITSSAVTSNNYAGVEVSDEGSSLDATASVFAATTGSKADGGAFGVIGRLNPTIHLSSCALVANQSGGVTTDRGEVTIDDTLLRDGFGFLAISGGHVDLRDSTFLKSGGGAIYLVFGPSRLTGTNVLIDSPVPDSGGQFGAGIVAGGPQKLDVTGLAVRGGHVAGVLLAQTASATLKQSLVSDVASGEFSVKDPSHTKSSADGIVATQHAKLTLATSRIEGCGQVGVLLDSSAGSIAESVSTGNQFGVVVDGTPAAMVDEASVFDGNSMGTLVNDSSLPVPSLPPALPQ